MDDKNYVPFKERAKNSFEIQLEEVLKQYSVVKVADVNGAHHGVDYEEMKQVILDTFFRNYIKRTITGNDSITGK